MYDNLIFMENALQFESRFSLPPNSLGYCGRQTAAYKFKACITKGNCEGVKEEVSKFIVLYPYLKTLSKITGKSKFSKEVIESYWIGNNLLKKAKPKDYLMLLNYFKKQGVPKFFVEELKDKPPHKFIPSHLFHVLYIGVGKASGAVKFNINTINDCMIRWGKVNALSKNKAYINLTSLSLSKNSYKLKTIKTAVIFDSKLIPDLKLGDTVAVHWQMVIKKLNEEEKNNLEFWTKEVLKLKL